MSAVKVAPRYTNPLLIKFLAELSTHPLRTKALTTGKNSFFRVRAHRLTCNTQGTLCFLQEVLGSKLAGAAPKVSKNASPLAHTLASAYIDAKAVKMALYGFLVSAPLSHCLVGALQKAFEGKTSTRDKILQILASNLLISPIQVAGLSRRLIIDSGSCSRISIFRINGHYQWRKLLEGHYQDSKSWILTCDACMLLSRISMHCTLNSLRYLGSFLH